MGLQTGLKVEYSSLAECESENWSDVLGVGVFQKTPAALRCAEVPVVEVGTPVLGESGDICEVWRTGRPIENGQWSRIRYRHDANVLFGCITVPEAESLPSASGGGSPLHGATKLAYREILAMLDAVGYRHLLRVWNYVPQINFDANGTERYWQFNSGRREALIALGRDVTGSLPAACALGSVAGPLTIYFLASRARPTLFENPRQTSAFDYPPQYGPSPVFSRASMLREASGTTLFVAGTASIVGHQTLHAGDAAAQTQETLANIDELLAAVNRSAGAAPFTLGELTYKVYVRNPRDLPVIQRQLQAALGSRAQVLYLKADICRRDLLVEIEATGFQGLDAGE